MVSSNKPDEEQVSTDVAHNEAQKVLKKIRPFNSTKPSSSERQSLASQTQAYTFATVIEADHDSISRLALRTIEANISLSTRLSHLTELLWRLIRHDISEELVMRPMFLVHMGSDGIKAATQDRHDHAELKRQLLGLYKEVVGANRERNRVDEEGLVQSVKALSREMSMHMKDESRIWLPQFESMVSKEVSQRLGEQYARTLVLTPEVCLPTAAGEDGKACFQSVMMYAEADVDVFRSILRRLEEMAKEKTDHGYLDRKVGEAMRRIGLNLPCPDDSSNHDLDRMKFKGNL